MVWFEGREKRYEFEWPALLDTGSSFTVFPGTLMGTFDDGYRESAIIEMPDPHDAKKSHTLELITRGKTWQRIGRGGGDRVQRHKFAAYLATKDFPELDWQDVIFLPQKAGESCYALVGIEILLVRGGICFSQKGFRPRLCRLPCL